VLDTNKIAVTSGGYLTELVCELLDAHLDTMSLARDLEDDPAWAAHLDYLRDLQRVGHEALAGMRTATVAVPVAAPAGARRVAPPSAS
jgi:hypothetical protein